LPAACSLHDTFDRPQDLQNATGQVGRALHSAWEIDIQIRTPLEIFLP
jgi:hypothetical protein